MKELEELRNKQVQVVNLADLAGLRPEGDGLPEWKRCRTSPSLARSVAGSTKSGCPLQVQALYQALGSSRPAY